MGQLPVIKLFGGPFDGQTLQVPETVEYFEWPHDGEEVTYAQGSFPFHYYYHTTELK